jgi:hypothetical protein
MKKALVSNACMCSVCVRETKQYCQYIPCHLEQVSSLERSPRREARRRRSLGEGVLSRFFIRTIVGTLPLVCRLVMPRIDMSNRRYYCSSSLATAHVSFAWHF